MAFPNSHIQKLSRIFAYLHAAQLHFLKTIWLLLRILRNAKVRWWVCILFCCVFMQRLAHSCIFAHMHRQGRSDRGYIGIYTRPKLVYLKFFYGVVFSAWPIYTHPNQIPGYASGNHILTLLWSCYKTVIVLHSVLQFLLHFAYVYAAQTVHILAHIATNSTHFSSNQRHISKTNL